MRGQVQEALANEMRATNQLGEILRGGQRMVTNLNDASKSALTFFQIATNPGQQPGPLAKIASGGELARLLLALKVVLAAANSDQTLIFDEVDSGIGGATAAAVGERLERLAESRQVLVVTHSPQVAARARGPLLVSKGEGKTGFGTNVTPLAGETRREEIARMLSGRDVTAEARAAATSLMAAAS